MFESLQFGRLTVIGDLLLDRYISGEVSRISPEAPVPVLLRTDRRVVPGGAANVAVNAATLGCAVQLIGLVGTDAAGHELRQALQLHSGIGLQGLVATPDWQTITKTRVLSGRQQIVRIDEERQVPDLPPDIEAQLIDRALQVLERSDILVVSDYAKGTLSRRVLETLITAARSRHVPVIVDPKRADLSVYRGATLITPNRAELRRSTGASELRTEQEIALAARQASEVFGGDVLLTRSEEGMTLWRQPEGTLHHVQARRAEVYDVSGAGDTVVAALAAGLSGGISLENAMTLAATAAGIAVGRLGTASVTRQELEEALMGDRLAGENMSPVHAVSWADAQRRIAAWRSKGASVVFTNGCFDLLHPGHISLISEAACIGDRLVVGLNSDASVRRLKGPTRPVQDEQARAQVMGALKGVDMVVVFDEDTPLELIQALQPDVLVKGADYREEDVVGGEIVRARGGRVHLAGLQPGRSTTSLVEKMRQRPASTEDKSAPEGNEE